MKKRYMTRRIGSGEDVKLIVMAESRQDAIAAADREFHCPWHVRKVTARPAKPGERDDRVSLKLRLN